MPKNEPAILFAFMTYLPPLPVARCTDLITTVCGDSHPEDHCQSSSATSMYRTTYFVACATPPTAVI